MFFVNNVRGDLNVTKLSQPPVILERREGSCGWHSLNLMTLAETPPLQKDPAEYVEHSAGVAIWLLFQ